MRRLAKVEEMPQIGACYRQFLVCLNIEHLLRSVEGAADGSDSDDEV